MTDEELKALVASLAIDQKELQKEIKETSKQIKELGKQIGGLGEKFGSFTEGFAFPSMRKVLAQKFGMSNIATQYEAQKEGKHMELDVLAYANGEQNKAAIV